MLLALLLSLPLLAPFAAPASAQDDAAQDETEPVDGESERDQDIDALTFDPSAGVADILQVSGLLDPLLADFVIDGIENASDGRVRLIILQVNSSGSVIDGEELDDVARAIANSPVPIAMWVGPSNAQARGPWVEMAALVDRLGIAPGARFGDLGEPQIDPSIGADWGAAETILENDTISAERALELGIASFPAPTVGEFLVGLEDLGVETTVVGSGEDARLVATTTPRFQRLSLAAGQLHTVASPPVAYLLFTIGLALLVFEFYTAGVGVAGVVGAGMFLLGCFGLVILPVNLFAIVLLVVSMFAFSIDVQTGVPRFWTIVGAIALVVGTVTLYRDGVSMSWIPMVVGIVGITMMMVTGMPTMVRTRFSTPTIGREWMIGSLGEAVEDVDPDGVVTIDDALWKARTNRATPVSAGDRVRVVAVEGLVLEIEPESGGARDYRERRGSRDESSISPEDS
ncbi:MAG: NfeD family protein [Actinomycetota bacterium]